MLLFCANKMNAQNQVIVIDDYKSVYIEAGILYPLGNLKSRILPSPNIGFWHKTKIYELESFDFGFNVSVIKSENNFVYEKKDSLFSNKPRGISGMVGFRYCKVFELSKKNKNINLELFPSFGYAFLMHKSTFTGFANPENTNSVNDKVSKRALSTLHIGQGLKLNFNNVGLHVQYQFTPYSLLYKYIDNDFGSQSLIFGIYYRQ